MIGALISLLSFILVISIIVVTHELGHYLAARLFGVRVLDFAIGWGPELASYKSKSGTKWKLCAIPIGGYIKYFGDADMTSIDSGERKFTEEEKKYSFAAQSSIKKSIMVAAGPLANFLTAILIFTYFFFVYGKVISGNVVTFIDPSSVAHKNGIQVGDTIKAVDGDKVDDFSDIERHVRTSPNIPLEFSIEREGKLITKTITPEAVEVMMYGDKVTVGKLGVGSDKLKRVKFGLVQSVIISVEETIKLSSLTLKAIGQILTGTRGTKEMASVIRISKYSGDSIKQGPIVFMQFIAMISINLGLVNLFPIPPLDGGHIFLYAVRGVAGKKVAGYVETYAVKIGIAILVALMIFAIINDIVFLRR